MPINGAKRGSQPYSELLCVFGQLELFGIASYLLLQLLLPDLNIGYEIWEVSKVSLSLDLVVEVVLQPYILLPYRNVVLRVKQKSDRALAWHERRFHGTKVGWRI